MDRRRVFAWEAIVPNPLLRLLPRSSLPNIAQALGTLRKYITASLVRIELFDFVLMRSPIPPSVRFGLHAGCYLRSPRYLCLAFQYYSLFGSLFTRDTLPYLPFSHLVKTNNRH
ncbi:hypothetical protein FRC08_014202 [Ceratobasidium sp. 394]|nr:hypothetical protein FRC08_014202 [Ceratobasidium sp. 394]